MGFVVGCLQAIYGEAIRMLEEYEKAVSAANHGGVRDHHTLYPHFGLACSPQSISRTGQLFFLGLSWIRA
ncbi:hypothetical protein M5K25_021411 [Dendrobium thyrsiflorum]|uniref:Uncharacterized protein n=1 Tax=Dendrobium thyrsiflorum TaxID=117978 RepID=A0ABD0UCA3_DENTH